MSIRHSKVLLAALSSKPSNRRRPYRRSLSTTPPPKRITVRNFSLVDYPGETIQILSDIAVTDQLGGEYFIDFLDKECLDIGPFMIFGLMRDEMTPNCRGGTIENNLVTVINAVGLESFLRMRFRYTAPKLKHALFPFRLSRHYALNAYSDGFELHSSAKEKHARRFANKLNDWLSHANFQLSSNGNDLVVSMISEILDNSRHANPSGDDGEWAIAGFMSASTDKNGNELFTCHLAIVTIGLTIGETIARCQDKKITEKVQAYSGKHVGASNKYSESTLMTLCALIDGVSCDGTESDNDVGGCGMSRLVDTLQMLGTSTIMEKEPKITVLSGNSCIRLMPPYNKMTSDMVQAPGSKFQAFNEQGDLSCPPDAQYVYDLPYRFPGTIVTLRFTIQQQEMMQVLETGLERTS